MSTEPMVLMAFSNPDPKRPLRNLPREEREVRRILETLVEGQKLDETQTLWNATWGDVAERLRTRRLHGRIRVFHYGGHADDATLMLADEHGTPVAWNTAGFLDYLAQHEGLELVVLNGCSTNAQIQRLRKTKIKAVVATTRAIKDELATDFAIELYTELVAGRPLKQAFDAATATLRGAKGKVGGAARAFVHEELAAHGEQIVQWPWVLSCEERDEGWMLVEEKTRGTGSMVNKNELVDELSRVLHDLGTARVVVSRIGFPRARVPDVRTAWEFWDIVVDALRSGTMEAKEQALIDEVATHYPGNDFFRRLRSKP